MSAAARVALVTGAASGIGASIASHLRHEGFLVAGFDLVPSDCDLSLEGDVSDGAVVAAAVAHAQRELGPIAAAINVAGYYEMLAISDITQAQWDRMLTVHLGGLFNLTKAVLPGMVELGTGSLVAITSELAIGGGDHDAHYAAAKGAILGFVRSLAVEVAPTGIRVNAVAPGPCDTPLLSADSPWRDRAYLDTLPAQRLADPNEIAVAVSYLINHDSFMVGETISVNSGAVI